LPPCLHAPGNLQTLFEPAGIDQYVGEIGAHHSGVGIDLHRAVRQLQRLVELTLERQHV
jgi:hypothetical protein